MNTTVEELNADADRRVGEVFRTMLVFTVCMVLGPISTYFLTKAYVFESNRCFKTLTNTSNRFKTKITNSIIMLHLGMFAVSSEASYIYSAISAIVVVHIILGAYIFVAWKDVNAEKIAKKKK